MYDVLFFVFYIIARMRLKKNQALRCINDIMIVVKLFNVKFT
jgi:hypothetical protein